MSRQKKGLILIVHRKNDKAATILAAARAVFMEQGYGGASMDMVAAEAGVSKATVYAHFNSKNELFARMVEEYCLEQADAIAQIEAQHADTPEALLRLARRLYAAWAAPGTLQFGRMMMGEASRFPELGRIFVRSGVLKVQERVAEFLAHLKGRGELAVSDPQVAAEFLIALTRSPVQIRSLDALGEPPTTAELEQLAEELVRLFLAAYGPER